MEYTIRKVVEKVSNGQIRIPSFQRGFVWEPENVAYLMDSLYKGYPFGTLLFWRTKEKLKTERKLGPFELVDPDSGFPLDYVLDGQQRITSIFGVFQTELTPFGDSNPFKIYFDFSSNPNAQETRFFAFDGTVDLNRYFPLNCLFDVQKYRDATSNLDLAKINIIDELQTKFKEAQIPIQILETEDKAKVAIVFERINRKGIALDTFQLLNAWTWSDTFDLQKTFEDLQEELEPFGFKGVGEDADLILRCAAGIIVKNASAQALISLNGTVVRDRFQEITNGLKGAIDFIKNNLKVEKLSNLPYDTLLIPLSSFFAITGNQQMRYTDNQRKVIIKWFWKSCFSKRFSAGVLRNLNKDIEEFEKLKNNQPNTLADFKVEIEKDFYFNNQFRTDAVNTKTFVLQLSQKNPLSFISGSPISLSNVLQNYNRNEFHHIYPKAYLKTLKKDDEEINSLINFCFMSKADNNALGGVNPSVYKAKMVGNLSSRLESTFISDILFSDDFDAFKNDRVDKLLIHARHLIS